MNKAERSRLLSTVGDSASEVIKTVGGGLAQSLYVECLLHELRLRGLNSRTNLVLPFNYKGLKPESLIVVPLFVDNEIPVDFVPGAANLPQAVARMQVLLRLLNRLSGLVIDFHADPTSGVHRVIAKKSERN